MRLCIETAISRSRKDRNLLPHGLLQNAVQAILLHKIHQPYNVIGCQENTQAVSQSPVVHPAVKILFLSYDFSGKQCNNKNAKSNYKWPENMVAKAFVNISFIKIHE